MAFPSINAKRIIQKRCGRCKYWSHRTTDPRYDCKTKYKCRHPEVQLTRKTDQWDQCVGHYERRKIKRIYVRAARKATGVLAVHDKHNKMIDLTIDYNNKPQLSNSKKTWLVAKYRSSVRFLGAGWQLRVFLTRKVTPEERLQLALMGELTND